MFKEGDIIVCINNEGYESFITLEKTYKVSYILHDNIALGIINNNNDNVILSSRRFISFSTFRKNKIKSLINEICINV